MKKPAMYPTEADAKVGAANLERVMGKNGYSVKISKQKDGSYVLHVTKKVN